MKPKDRFTNNHNQIVNFINYFGERNGFIMITSIIAYNEKNQVMPLEIIISLL